MPQLLDYIGGKVQVDWRFLDVDQIPEEFDLYGYIPDPDFGPLEVEVLGNITKLPDFSMGPYTNYIFVSNKFRDLVEKFEPNAHRFVPINLHCRGVDVLRDHVFLFRIAKFVDSGILVSESHVKEVYEDGVLDSYNATSITPQIMWDKEEVKDRHIWSDSKLYNWIAVSDEFYGELNKLNTTGFRAIESRVSGVSYD